MSGPPWAWLMLPAARLEVAGKNTLLELLGVMDDTRWTNARFRRVRCKHDGALADVNMAERFERLAYFLGRYHELPLQLLMRRCLRPGEVFIDVGANIGLVTLLASSLAGPTGRVFAYEPNPQVFARLQGHITLNNRQNVVARPLALGAATGTLDLTVIGANTGSGSLGSFPSKMQNEVTARYRVEVVPGDVEGVTWQADRDSAPVMIKLDAEGAETAILRGLERTVRTKRPLIVSEVNPFALGINGSSPRELRKVLADHGYSGFTLQSRRCRLRQRLVFDPLPPLPVRELHDEVWVHPEGPHYPRVADLLSEPLAGVQGGTPKT